MLKKVERIQSSSEYEKNEKNFEIRYPKLPPWHVANLSSLAKIDFLTIAGLESLDGFVGLGLKNEIL